MIVVLSLSTTMRLARPRSVITAFSSLKPTSSLIDLAVRQNGDVLQHRLATIAEARRLDGADLERAAELVHDERRERLTFDVLGDDEQRAALLRDLLEHREQILHRRDLLVVDEDVAHPRATASIFSGSVTKYGET